MIGGLPNRPLYFFQKDIIGDYCSSQQWYESQQFIINLLSLYVITMHIIRQLLQKSHQSIAINHNPNIFPINFIPIVYQ